MQNHYQRHQVRHNLGKRKRISVKKLLLFFVYPPKDGSAWADCLSARLHFILLLAGGLPIAYCFFPSCSNNTTQDNKNNTTTNNNTPHLSPSPKFNEDSAYTFVKAQVDFGPRVPGTASHAKCAENFVAKFISYGWEVQVQNGNIRTYDGK